ncbi:U4/U6 small nuclear ribonucleoprotein PRP3 [Kwoniella mangroviensis CBS 10435]|uniref:U4/U6 small nuclear ribonucleoprotein PRP3 n=1 Tax=Kwoniella mangroviensis CBS 10435 TaxID=1331196 RepID=A0A1B9IR58_9TREE|nr:U4/U6 small nuclear ribonucleoprotein PRP3 [Kwoniella mangroviensis CBS 10435]
MSGRRAADGTAYGQPDPKRAKVNTPAPAPPPGAPLDMAAIRAQIAARKAQLEAAAAASRSTPPVVGPASGSASPAPAPGPAALPPRPAMDASIADRLAAAKARIEALNARAANPYLSGSGAIPKPSSESQPSASSSSTSGQPGVSSIALHPLLMGQSQAQQQEVEKNEKKAMRDRYKTMAPKFTSVKANAAVASTSTSNRASPAAPVLNPYATTPTPSGSGTPVPDEERAPIRRSKKLQFSRAGKYVAQGDALRNEQKMEALRQRIAEASRKAGLDSEFDTLERSLKRQPPPDVEWWDKAILPEGKGYEDLEDAVQFMTTHQDSLITHLIQHPIPIPAPSDKKQPERGLMLTKKEQKKMRRQRRQAELEDKRDRQKMGLLPPDPPKVRLANLMKVLTSDAVQDPTKVEAKVRKEVAQRANKHERDNQERKLTAEQRKEKEYNALVARERKGIHGAVFKVKYLTNGRHRFKIRETAKSDLLSGVCIFHPKFALVLVEGVDKSIKHYKKLLLNRIDWTEEARPLNDNEYENEEDEDDDRPKTNGGNGDGEGPESLEDNKCELIWEGEVPERTFRLFRARHAETDTKAKEWLTPKWEGMWDLAKRWVWEGEE